MNSEFPPEWQQWITENRERGCSEEEIGSILLKQGFDAAMVCEEVGLDISGNVSEIAKDQVILAKAMELRHYWLRDDWVSLAGAEEVTGDGMIVYTIDHFLDQAECDELVSIIHNDNVPSTVTRENEDAEFRTSYSANLHHTNNALVHDLDRRIARYLGINQSHSEFIQGQLYDVGQQFKLHPDYFDDLDYESHCLNQGQRTWTFMLYLNDPEAGGETEFPHAGIKIQPKMGRAVVWNNLDPYGVRNPKAMHQGLPVEKGSKAIITKWFRQFPADPALLKEQGEFHPTYTERGWEKLDAPEAVCDLLKRVVDDSDDVVDEFVPGGYLLDKSGADRGGSALIETPEPVKQQVGEILQPLAEQWAGVGLKLEAVYGIRRYHEGASLIMHRDRNETHIISVILNVDQDVDEDWHLHIDDHLYRTSQIALSPGEMIFYEGAKLLHGRPDPLIGRRYDNLFVHYSPTSR